jgi:lipoyl(octanoyl) transferase
LTCYPIVDLKRQPELSLEFYVQNLAKVMKETLSKAYNLNDSYYDNDPIRVGLWLPSNKKIGFIGIQAQKWITSHGFSINIKRESLKGFHDIDPCGLSNQNMTVTCVEDNIENNTVTKDVLVLSDLIIDSFISTYRYSLTK